MAGAVRHLQKSALLAKRMLLTGALATGAVTATGRQTTSTGSGLTWRLLLQDVGLLRLVRDKHATRKLTHLASLAAHLIFLKKKKKKGRWSAERTGNDRMVQICVSRSARATSTSLSELTNQWMCKERRKLQTADEIYLQLHYLAVAAWQRLSCGSTATVMLR